MNVTTGSRKVHRPGPKNAAGQVPALCGGAAPQRTYLTTAEANCRKCDDAVIEEQNKPSAERIAEIHPAAPVRTFSKVQECRGAKCAQRATFRYVIADSNGQQSDTFACDFCSMNGTRTDGMGRVVKIERLCTEPVLKRAEAAAPSLEAQLGQARETMATMIAQGFGLEVRERQERRINALKVKIQRQTAENASVAASADSLARELNISIWDLVKTLAKGAGPATRLSSREAAILRTVHGR